MCRWVFQLPANSRPHRIRAVGRVTGSVRRLQYASGACHSHPKATCIQRSTIRTCSRAVQDCSRCRSAHEVRSSLALSSRQRVRAACATTRSFMARVRLTWTRFPLSNLFIRSTVILYNSLIVQATSQFRWAPFTCWMRCPSRTPQLKLRQRATTTTTGSYSKPTCALPQTLRTHCSYSLRRTLALQSPTRSRTPSHTARSSRSTTSHCSPARARVRRTRPRALPAPHSVWRTSVFATGCPTAWTLLVSLDCCKLRLA